MKPVPVLVVTIGLVGLLWTISSSTSNPWVYLNVEGFFIVFGGALMATVLSFPYADILKAVRDTRASFRNKDRSLVQLLDEIEALAETMILEGVDGIEKRLQAGNVSEGFLRLGLGMVVDQVQLEKIERVMEATLVNQQERDMIPARVVRALAKYAPAFGMAGTLVGMIAMFQEMGTNLDGIGPAMAVAMMTTFYGLLLANLIFSPFAAKLERGVESRALSMSVILEGTLLLARKTPPVLLRQELSTFLDPAEAPADQD